MSCYCSDVICDIGHVYGRNFVFVLTKDTGDLNITHAVSHLSNGRTRDDRSLWKSDRCVGKVTPEVKVTFHLMHSPGGLVLSAPGNSTRCKLTVQNITLTF